MTRTTVVAALGALALGTAMADAQQAPALEAPLESSGEPSSGSPPDPPPAERPRPVEPPRSRPLLVIPGVTAPPSQRTARKPVDRPATPSLDAAIARPEPDVPLRLESIPDDATPAAAPKGRTSTPDPAKGAGTRESRGASSSLGRFMGAADVDARDALSIESSGDPAVEAAVKRRVEKQVADALGSRVADVKVRVSGRSVSIHARATRLWYRWGARRTLESLAMPPGYRGRAVVD